MRVTILRTLIFPLSLTTRRVQSWVRPIIPKPQTKLAMTTNGNIFLSPTLFSNTHVTLASKSPRRREILDMMGLEGKYTVTPSPCDETALQERLRTKKLPPESYVQILSDEKASAVVPECRNDGTQIDVVIGSDTIVDLDGTILEKPVDENDAVQMLSRLSGRWHSVHTGVAIQVYVGGMKVCGSCFTESTMVKFAELTDDDINAYVSTGEPMDKAGSYGIQGVGGRMVEEIKGDFFAVMGLPMHRLSLQLVKLVMDAEGKIR